MKRRKNWGEAMRREFKIMRVSYPDIQIPQWQGRCLRGFFGSERIAGSLLHNHKTEGVAYRYPLVQYKVIHGTPTIVAIEDGISEIYPLVMERETLRLGDQEYNCGKIIFDLRKDSVGDRKDPRSYRFLSPWFALNQENYQTYLTSSQEGKERLLERILVGNVLSLTKGLGVTVETQLQSSCQLRGGTSEFKGETVLSFRGTFCINYDLPDLCGIGKSISRGFGTISQLNEQM